MSTCRMRVPASSAPSGETVRPLPSPCPISLFSPAPPTSHPHSTSARTATRNNAEPPPLTGRGLWMLYLLGCALQDQFTNSRGIRLALHGVHHRADHGAGGLHFSVLDLVADLR